jgi:hypothetical protein
MTIMLAYKKLRVSMGDIKDVPISIGPYPYPTEFRVVDMLANSYCQIIFGKTFLNTVGANVDCKKETISLKFGEDEIKFLFSKFQHNPTYEKFEEQEEEEGNTITSLGSLFYETRDDDISRKKLG